MCSGLLVLLGKDGRPIDTAKTSPRKESEWSLFSKVSANEVFPTRPGGAAADAIPSAKVAFKRIKNEQPSLTMTQINQLVAAEWQIVKARNQAQIVPGLENALGSLRL